MLRLVYADQGAKEDLLGAVQAARGWAEGRFVEGREQVQGYLADGGPFPERLHIIALFARFYADLFELIIQWSELAEAEIQAWPRTDDLGMTERTRALLEELVSRPTAGHGAMHRPSAQQADRIASTGVAMLVHVVACGNLSSQQVSSRRFRDPPRDYCSRSALWAPYASIKH